ncbi:MAG TPA: cytochrome c family protein, partial [Anaeromyxobacteraceae bacterium]
YGEIARENLRLARAQRRPCPDPASGAASYVGIDDPPRGGTFGCRTCHAAAVDFWRTTAHARAFATLERGGRQYDLDCVGCHVTGWREAGGACSVADTAWRRDVQCESCHGPASLHAVDPPGHLERDPGEARCRRCHTDDHSTTFEYLSYRRRILGPGHGAAGGK